MSFFSREMAATKRVVNGRLVDDEMADIRVDGNKIELTARNGPKTIHRILTPTQHTIFSKPINSIPLAKRLLADYGIKTTPRRTGFAKSAQISATSRRSRGTKRGKRKGAYGKKSRKH